jgi:hypothetical protein
MHDDKNDFNGVIMSLGQFYGHKDWGKYLRRNGFKNDARLFLASDHLVFLDIPENFPEELILKIKLFQQNILSKKETLILWDEGDILFEQCRQLMCEIDEHIKGVVIK